GGGPFACRAGTGADLRTAVEGRRAAAPGAAERGARAAHPPVGDSDAQARAPGRAAVVAAGKVDRLAVAPRRGDGGAGGRPAPDRPRPRQRRRGAPAPALDERLG